MLPHPVKGEPGFGVHQSSGVSRATKQNRATVSEALFGNTPPLGIVWFLGLRAAVKNSQHAPAEVKEFMTGKSGKRAKP